MICSRHGKGVGGNALQSALWILMAFGLSSCQPWDRVDSELAREVQSIGASIRESQRGGTVFVSPSLDGANRETAERISRRGAAAVPDLITLLGRPEDRTRATAHYSDGGQSA